MSATSFVSLCITSFLLTYHAQGQSTHTLSHPQASYTFEYNATEAWLVNGTLTAGNRVVPFHKTSMWEIALRVDPEISVESDGITRGDPFVSESKLKTETANFPVSVIPVPNLDYDQDGVQDRAVFFEWTGSFPDNDAGDGGGAAPSVKIDAFWLLNGVKDYLQTIVVVEILNLAEEPRYKVWRCSYPRIDVCNLDDNGEDRLATGRYGGLLYGNPINFTDQHIAAGDTSSQHFVYQLPFSNNTGLPHLTAVEPGGVHTVPLWCYYTTTGGYGVYIANNDDAGMFKGVQLFARPEVPACPMAQGPGALGFETIQYPHSLISTGTGIFDMTRYESPYAVFIGVFNGDWVDAAKKYRDYRVNNEDERFTWLHDGSRPSGKDTNPFIPDELKGNPYQVRITGGEVSRPWSGTGPESPGNLNGGGYCNDDLITDSGDCISTPCRLVARDRLAFFEHEFALGTGPGFPLLLFDRFPVAAEEVLYDPATDTAEYRPNTTSLIMQEIHAFFHNASNRPPHFGRHLVVLDSMTEKFNQNELWNNACDRIPHCGDPPGPWCCAVNPEYRKLAFLNALVPHATRVELRDDCVTGLENWGYEPFGTACTAGKATTLVGDTGSGCMQSGVMPPCGAKWSSAFKHILRGASWWLGARGLRTNAPSTMTSPCFSKHHDHLPGFGSTVLDGWYSIFQSLRDALGDDMVFLSEVGGATFSKYHRVQNPISVSFSTDIENQKIGGSPIQWNRYFDAPIWKIPLLQMVADECRFAADASYPSLALPWTKASHIAKGPDIDGDLCSNTRRYFQYPNIACAGSADADEGDAVEFPAVPAALNCWSMAKRVLGHQASILIDDHNMAAAATGDPLSVFDPNPTTTTGHAARGMLEFYKGLGTFLMSVDYMEYFTGTMERSPVLQIQGSTSETFSIPAATIAAAFKNLHKYFTLPYDGSGLPGLDPALYRPDADWVFDRYRPVDRRIFTTIDFDIGNFAVTTTPDEHETWLPHGMYRSWRDSSKLALFVTNPWGVKHLFGDGQTRPMNIFTFDFQNPGQSPSNNTYFFQFSVNPTDYDGFDASTVYSVVRTRFNKDGTPFPPVDLGSGSGTRVFTTSIPAFQYEAFLIDFQ